MKDRIIAATLALCAVAIPATAKEKILVNSEVTTHIVMPENIKMVDLSTTKIIGNQCADNIVRIKPFIEADSVPTHYREGELMGTLTLIGERHLAQYDVVYTAAPSRAASIHRVPYAGLDSYINPEVSMPQTEMARYAWAIYGSGRKYNQVVSKANGMKAIVNNMKVLRIEISENQISGRVITLTVEYDDILNADGFDSDILKNLPFNYSPHIYK